MVWDLYSNPSYFTPFHSIMYPSPLTIGICNFVKYTDLNWCSVAVFLSWARQHISAADPISNPSYKNPTVLGCIAGSAILRKAAALAFSDKKRSTVTGDIIERLGKSLEGICPAS